MSLDLTMNSADFTSGAIGIELPVMNGLVSFGMFGDSAGVSPVEGGTQPAVIGSPARNTAYSTIFSAGNYLDLGVKETADMTVMAIGKVYAPGSASNMQWLGNYYATVTEASATIPVQGTGIVLSNGGVRQWVSASYTGVAGAASNANVNAGASETGLPTTLETGAWRCLAGVTDSSGAVGAAGLRYLNDFTTNYARQVALVSGNVRDLRNRDNLRVGILGSGITTTNRTELAGYVVYNRALSQAELAQMYAYFKSVMALYSVTI